MNECCEFTIQMNKEMCGNTSSFKPSKFCPQCGTKIDSIKYKGKTVYIVGNNVYKNKREPVYCISCEHFRDDEYNWRSQKYEDGGEEWEMVGACWADENRKANWKSEEGARNKLPCNINANNDCPWYKNKYWGD